MRFSHRYGVAHTLAGFFILTFFATVVLAPFGYMLLISFKNESEMGSGRILPEQVAAFFRRGALDALWVEADLSKTQAATVAKGVTAHAAPGYPITTNAVDSLPRGAQKTKLISLSKAGNRSEVVRVLLEAHKTEFAGRPEAGATIYVPTERGKWEPVAAQPVKRSAINMLGRLVANYTSLIGWNDLRSGRILTWISAGYPRWYINSLFVAFATVALGLFFDSLAAFAFAKFNFPFRDALFALLIATIMIPPPVTLVPTFFIFAKMDLYNTYAALIIPGMVSAFGIFLVRQYMRSIPDDMLDAARVDGASDFSVYRHIVIPTARPVLAALAVFRFIWQWNTYLYPLVLTNKDSMKTIQLGLATMEDAHGTVDYGMQMAGAALAVIPILIVYAFMQKHFIAGITMGSVKD